MQKDTKNSVNKQMMKYQFIFFNLRIPSPSNISLKKVSTIDNELRIKTTLSKKKPKRSYEKDILFISDETPNKNNFVIKATKRTTLKKFVLVDFHCTTE